jgi:hypothetical protein
MTLSFRSAAAYLAGLLVWGAALIGCEPLYLTSRVILPVETRLPVAVTGDDVWVTSIPVGADVYFSSYDPETLPFHATAPQAYRGKTPLRFTVPPGQYWVEVAFDADLFSSFFSPPYDDAQFERDGAGSEALLFKPFAPGDKRRVLRYYRFEKLPRQGQTVIALFQPRGAAMERVAPFYPQDKQYEVAPQQLQELLQAAQVPAQVQEQFVQLMQRGGKAFWSKSEDYKIGLEVREDGIIGHIIARYTGPPRPDPLVPDGGGF